MSSKTAFLVSLQISFIISTTLLPPTTLAINNGLALTPQMGWNNWNTFACSINSSLLLTTASLLHSTGLSSLGYHYLILDDCWSAGRNATGHLVPDPVKFPEGMRYVADAVHAMGLGFGMYASAGEFTCARYAGSLDHEDIDAATFAAWGVDYLKYDNCYHRGRFGFPEVSFNRFNRMAEALRDTGRRVLLSLCSWGEDYVHTWGMSIANSWRVFGDVYDSFARPDDLCACTDERSAGCVAPGSHCSVLSIVNKVAPFVDRGGPGGWNDLDMLEVGRGGMTDDEYVAHFSMWAALKSPLIIGSDLRGMKPETLSILNNPAVIAVNQDPMGRSATRIIRKQSIYKDEDGTGEVQVWTGPLYGGDQVLIFLNAAIGGISFSIDLNTIFVQEGPRGSAPQSKETWDVYDLWANRMSNKEAQQILNAVEDDRGEVFRRLKWYNSTEISYEEGLKKGDPRLLGKKIGQISPAEGLRVALRPHSAVMYRLRRASEKESQEVVGSTKTMGTDQVSGPALETFTVTSRVEL